MQEVYLPAVMDSDNSSSSSMFPATNDTEMELSSSSNNNNTYDSYTTLPSAEPGFSNASAVGGIESLYKNGRLPAGIQVS